MDSKFVKPSVFNADTNSKQASKEWRHLYIFRFRRFFPTEPVIFNKDKLKCLIAPISKDVCNYMSKCLTYQKAIQTLERL